MLDVEDVAGRPRLQALAAYELAQLGDVYLERLLGRLGRLVLPQRIDQPVARNHPIGLEEQQREERALLVPAEVE